MYIYKPDICIGFFNVSLFWLHILRQINAPSVGGAGVAGGGGGGWSLIAVVVVIDKIRT